MQKNGGKHRVYCCGAHDVTTRLEVSEVSWMTRSEKSSGVAARCLQRAHVRCRLQTGCLEEQSEVESCPRKRRMIAAGQSWSRGIAVHHGR